MAAQERACPRQGEAGFGPKGAQSGDRRVSPGPPWPMLVANGQGGVMLGRIGLVCGIGMAGPALAHPHVFIEAEIAAILNAEGSVEAPRITWT